MVSRGVNHLDRGNGDKAYSWLAGAVIRSRTRLGENHQLTIEAMEYAALACQRREAYSHAVMYLEHSIERSFVATKREDEDQSIDRLMAILGINYAKLSRYNNAIEALSCGLSLSYRIRGDLAFRYLTSSLGYSVLLADDDPEFAESIFVDVAKQILKLTTYANCISQSAHRSHCLKTLCALFSLLAATAIEKFAAKQACHSSVLDVLIALKSYQKRKRFKMEDVIRFDKESHEQEAIQQVICARGRVADYYLRKNKLSGTGPKDGQREEARLRGVLPAEIKSALEVPSLGSSMDVLNATLPDGSAYIEFTSIEGPVRHYLPIASIGRWEKERLVALVVMTGRNSTTQLLDIGSMVEVSDLIRRHEANDPVASQKLFQPILRPILKNLPDISKVTIPDDSPFGSLDYAAFPRSRKMGPIDIKRISGFSELVAA